MRMTAKTSAKDGGEPNCASGRASASYGQVAIAPLSLKKPNRFLYLPGRGVAAAMARDINVIEIKKLRFEGEIASSGNCRWHLRGRLGATAVQECVVTLAPVKTRLDTEVVRNISTEKPQGATSAYARIPELDIDVVAGWIDLGEIAREVLLLELPTYPKIKDAEMPVSNFSDEFGSESLGADRQPFASLSELRNRLCG